MQRELIGRKLKLNNIKIVETKPLMKCGHAANATTEGKPCCAICIGIDAGAEEIAETPNLEGRKSKCGCGKVISSNMNLPFFEYCSDKEYDHYYCGHGGWN